MYDAPHLHVLLAHKFTGKERDAATGLDNFGARYNSSATGRFMSPDPKFLMKQKLVDPQQWNVVDRSEGGHSQFAREWAAESVSQDIVQGLTPPGMGATFTVRGIEIFNSDTMLDGSRKGAWLRTTRAFDAAVKDYQEDQKNDNE